MPQNIRALTRDWISDLVEVDQHEAEEWLETQRQQELDHALRGLM